MTGTNDRTRHARTGLAPRILLHDTGQVQRTGTSAGPDPVDELVARGARILVGLNTPDVLAAAQTAQIPFVALSDRALPSGAIQIIQSQHVRTAALALKATEMGIRRFALLAPKTESGRALLRTFSEVVESSGGRVVAETYYDPGQKNQRRATATIAKTMKTKPEAVFIPLSGAALTQFAPTLAAQDLWPSPWTEVSTFDPDAHQELEAWQNPDRRPVVLIALGHGLSPKRLKNAERYLQGSLLAPGFYPASVDEVGGTRRARLFSEKHTQAFGRPPGQTTAFAFDAVLVALAHLGARPNIQQDTDPAVDGNGVRGPYPVRGVTGDIVIGIDGGRIDAPVVFEVTGKTIRPLTGDQ